MMKYETPLEYSMIMGDKDVSNYFYEPPVEDIEMIARASNDPSFRKPKFNRYLEEYKKDGICCGRPKIMTAKRAEYYENMYNRKLYELGKIHAPSIDKRIRLAEEIEELKM